MTGVWQWLGRLHATVAAQHRESTGPRHGRRPQLLEHTAGPANVCARSGNYPATYSRGRCCFRIGVDGGTLLGFMQASKPLPAVVHSCLRDPVCQFSKASTSKRRAQGTSLLHHTLLPPAPHLYLLVSLHPVCSAVLGLAPALPSILSSVLTVDRTLMLRYRELQATAAVVAENFAGSRSGAADVTPGAPAVAAAAADRPSADASVRADDASAVVPPVAVTVGGSSGGSSSGGGSSSSDVAADTTAGGSSGAPANGSGAPRVVANIDGTVDLPEAPAVMDGVLLRRPRLIQAILTRKERGVAAVQPMLSWL